MARQWVHEFVPWYNEQHRHRGEDGAILEQRKAVYEAEKKENPSRWSGDIRNWNPVTEVWLNPPKEVRAKA